VWQEWQTGASGGRGEAKRRCGEGDRIEHEKRGRGRGQGTEAMAEMATLMTAGASTEQTTLETHAKANRTSDCALCFGASKLAGWRSPSTCKSACITCTIALMQLCSCTLFTSHTLSLYLRLLSSSTNTGFWPNQRPLPLPSTSQLPASRSPSPCFCCCCCKFG